MLGKLLKYDLKAELKSLLPVYLIVSGLVVVLRILEMLKNSFSFLTTVYGFFVTITIISLIGVVIWTLITSIRHFYTNILKDEGYLTNTLPVSRNQIILSKEITAFITMMLTGVVVIAGAMLAFYHGSVQELFTGLGDALEAEGIETMSFMVWLVAMMAISYISQILMIFAAMMLGQTRNSSKVMFSIVFGIILYTLTQLVSLVALGVDFIIAPDLMTALDAVNPSIADVYDYMVLVFASTIVITIVMVVVYHMISVYIANRKLNLE